MSPNNINKPSDDFIRIQDLFYIFLNKWYWFVIAVVIALSIAFIYLAKTPPVYTRTASVLIKDNSNSSTADNATFADLGIFRSNTNIINELYTFQSPSFMMEVVRRLKLDNCYMLKNGLRNNELYNRTPCTVTFSNLNENQSLSCSIQLLPERKFKLSNFTADGLEVEMKPVSGVLNDSVSTPWGMATVEATLFYSPESVGTQIEFYKSGLQATTKEFGSALSANLTDEKSTIIDLKITDVSIQRAEDVLNTLIRVYQENWINDKNEVAISNSKFLKKRLNEIGGDLNHVDDSISTYKSKNLLVDVQANSTMHLAQSSENKSKIHELETRLSITRYIKEHMNDSGLDELIPLNMGMEASIESLIQEYNTCILQRKNYLVTTNETHPRIASLNNTLISLRQSIMKSLDNSIQILNNQINNIKKIDFRTNQNIASNPGQAKDLLSIERQQKVKEELYVFLLKKQAENDLSQTFTAHNTKVIKLPSGSNFPTAPVKKNILLVALAIGCLIPAVILFLLESMNNKIRSKKDLSGLSIPYLGEIPLAEKKKNTFLKKEKIQENLVLVGEERRDRINEAFRIIRTNLSFMQGNKEDCKVIMATSFNPGSGKTFTIANLGISLALTGKKVITIDLDMRRGALSTYVSSPKCGISNYLAGFEDSVDNIIVKAANELKIDIIPVGVFPPNPTELLLNGKLDSLLDTLKKRYDYVLIDCTPVEVVADAAIIGKLVDMTLFIVRAGLLDKRMLFELEMIYSENKYTNLSVLLNGVDYDASKYGYNRYEYHSK